MTDSDKRYIAEMQRYAAEEYANARKARDMFLTATHPVALFNAAMRYEWHQLEADSFARCARRTMGVE